MLFRMTVLSVGMIKKDVWLCDRLNTAVCLCLTMQPIAILECRAFCSFSKGLNTNSAAAFQQLAQDIASPHPWLQNKNHALDNDMTVDKPQERRYKGVERLIKSVEGISKSMDNLGQYAGQPSIEMVVLRVLGWCCAQSFPIRSRLTLFSCIVEAQVMSPPWLNASMKTILRKHGVRKVSLKKLLRFCEQQCYLLQAGKLQC